MNFLKSDNYVNIEGLVNRIIARQNAIKEKYLATNIKDLMDVISADDLKEWYTLQNDLNYLTPIYNNQRVS